MSRLLLLCEYATLNGGEQSMLATLDGVQREGFEVVVAGPPQGALAETLHARGVEVIPFCARDAAGKRLPQLRLREELAAILARRRPDLLHANSLAMGRLSGPVAADAGLPSLAHLRDIIKLSRQAVADLNCHTRLLAVSEATQRFHVAGGLEAGKTFVLYNGVDLDQFRPRPATGYLHRELGLPADAPLVGTIGQIGLRKGQDVLLQGIATLVPRLPDVHWLLVGARHSEKAESRRLESDLHRAAAAAPDRVHFLGIRADVPRLLNELTLLVHPARQEPLGRVLLEAAAAGLPVVTTDVGGTREIFLPGSASLVAPDDPAALAEAVLHLRNDEPHRRRLAAAARRRAEETFSAERAAEGLIAHYRETVRSPAFRRS